MQFEIILSDAVMNNFVLYREYSVFIYKHMKKHLKYLVKKHIRHYAVREEYILTTKLINWKNDPPRHLDLGKLIENCIELILVQGVYIIRINPKQRIPKSNTTVSKLVRILEYGTDKIPAFPLLIKLFRFYHNTYKTLYYEFMKERFGL